MHVADRLARLPLRLRLTLAFTALLAAVFAGFGIFVYLHLKAGLDGGIRQALRDRAALTSTLVGQLGPRELAARRPPLEPAGSFAQVLAADGRVLDGSPRLGRRSLLAPSELAEARQRAILLERGERARLLAEPVAGEPGLVVVVGTSLAQRERAMESLAGALLVGGPLAFLLAAAAGYALAAAALRPVETMRRRAQTISADEPRARLPLPPAQDEIHRLGETLNEMLDRLEAALARERTFVADASHELRTPLTVLRMELELALQHGRSPDELRDALASALEETDRLTRLAEDLLVLARADRGGVPVRPRRLDVARLLAGVAQRFVGQGAQEGRAIEVRCPPELHVEADELRLEQALGNLVANALRYGEGDVVLAAHRRPGGVELHVRDRGPGFPPGFLAHAFERFTRAEEARERGGTGLGLAIVAAIAHAHGGEVRAANRPDGADVSLSLPQPPAAPAAPAEREAPAGPG